MKNRELMARLSKAMAKIDEAYHSIAQKHGLSYNALMLFYCILETENLTQKQVCSALYLSKSTVHSMLLDLQKKDYLILTSGNNKKEKFIVLTEKGNILANAIVKDTDILENAVLEHYGLEKSLYYVQEAEHIADTFLQFAKEHIHANQNPTN